MATDKKFEKLRAIMNGSAKDRARYIPDMDLQNPKEGTEITEYTRGVFGMQVRDVLSQRTEGVLNFNVFVDLLSKGRAIDEIFDGEITFVVDGESYFDFIAKYTEELKKLNIQKIEVGSPVHINGEELLEIASSENLLELLKMTEVEGLNVSGKDLMKIVSSENLLELLRMSEIRELHISDSAKLIEYFYELNEDELERFMAGLKDKVWIMSGAVSENSKYFQYDIEQNGYVLDMDLYESFFTKLNNFNVDLYFSDIQTINLEGKRIGLLHYRIDVYHLGSFGDYNSNWLPGNCHLESLFTYACNEHGVGYYYGGDATTYERASMILKDVKLRGVSSKTDVRTIKNRIINGNDDALLVNGVRLMPGESCDFSDEEKFIYDILNDKSVENTLTYNVKGFLFLAHLEVNSEELERMGVFGRFEKLCIESDEFYGLSGLARGIKKVEVHGLIDESMLDEIERWHNEGVEFEFLDFSLDTIEKAEIFIRLAEIGVSEFMMGINFAAEAMLRLSRINLLNLPIDGYIDIYNDPENESETGEVLDILNKHLNSIDNSLEVTFQDFFFEDGMSISSNVSGVYFESCEFDSDEGLVNLVKNLPNLENLTLKDCGYKFDEIDKMFTDEGINIPNLLVVY